ncbi:MAG: TerB family tellurite resistance protein [Cyclobacteriaceae bacterium]|nr:TerB family tellurite resistance protein [Cyclobacteriaceae bacterium]
MVIHKTFADFVLFLYIHMAHADGEFHPLEEKEILLKIPKLFPGLSDMNAKLQSALTEYRAVAPASLPQLIRDTFNHFSTVKFAQKYKVYTDMYDIINADGKVDERETVALAALKEIIDLNAHQQ